MHCEETTSEVLSLSELDIIVGGVASAGRYNDVILGADGNDVLSHSSPAQFHPKIKHEI